MSGEQDKSRVDPTERKRPTVIDRGSISGSGDAMSDDKALRLLRRKRNTPGPDSPSIGVVVKGTTASPGQFSPLGTLAKVEQPSLPIEITPIRSYFSSQIKTISDWEDWHGEEHRPFVVEAPSLDSTMGSILDKCSYRWLHKEPLSMRLYLDAATLDFDLPEQELDRTATLRQLINHYFSTR